MLARATMGFGELRVVMTGRGGGGGWAVFRHPTICQTAGPILDPKMSFDDVLHGLSECIANFYLKINDDVTGEVKCDTSEYRSSLALPGKVASQTGTKPMKRHALCVGYL